MGQDLVVTVFSRPALAACGAVYVGVRGCEAFNVFCLHLLPGSAVPPPSLHQCKATTEMGVSMELVPCPAPALTCHLNHSAYITFVFLHYSSLDFKLTKHKCLSRSEPSGRLLMLPAVQSSLRRNIIEGN